ncbi:MAG: 4Fe-4S dicluster domain-containing protein [Deltaproteobacteria bacterium]|nr:4Fe-4S dicluster domain-containing protein [Deltaproteobacteria bacterium]
MIGGIIKRITDRYRELRVPGYYSKPDHRFGMVIDLDKCNGCEACVVSCYAENNVPVVGKKQVGKARAMSWIRVERYIEGEYPDVKVKFIPIMCQQCGKAPCEVGCPVYATYHNQDGLNVQVYNRCVGTFTCATYCPYDVRRFNWFSFKFDKPLDEQLSPDVTVREMGVMEKCTFCIQRIRAAKDKAKDEDREVRDGEIQPACAQSCPTDAMVFGDLDDPESKAAKLAKSPRRYRLLEELNADPSVIYLKRVMDDGGKTHG